MVVDTRCELKAFLLAGIRRRDLAKASRRQDQAGMGAAIVAERKRMLRALPVQGLHEAARAVSRVTWSQEDSRGIGKSTTGGSTAGPRRRP